jgi:hypothetical protein
VERRGGHRGGGGGAAQGYGLWCEPVKCEPVRDRGVRRSCRLLQGRRRCGGG